MLKRIFFLLVAVATLSAGYDARAQEGRITKEDMQLLQGLENDLVLATDSMYHSPIDDMHIVYCENFVKLLVRALKVPNSFYYPFTKLQEKINIIYPDDKAFRIFNWNIATSELNLRYYGAIQMPAEMLKLYPLVDYSQEMTKGVEDSILTGSKWFGAIYYNVIKHEVDGEPVYTLFGLNSASMLSNRKVLDPLRITPDGPVFGAPIFNVRLEPGQRRVNRFVLEYKKDAQASMNWDKELNAIFFDRLVSSMNDPNRKYTFVPSGQYDGLRWGNNEHWNFVADLIPLLQMKDGDAPAPKPVNKQVKE
jgi:hypothetical protein